MKPIEGASIITHGQEVIITNVIKIKNNCRCYINKFINVKGEEHSRDYIDPIEIETYKFI